MAFLGRETQADARRIERCKRWIDARSPYALVSLGAGLLAVVDCIALVIGIPMGVAAIVAGRLGLRDLSRRPTLLGRRLCFAGITLGVLGLLLSAAVWLWIFPWLKAR